MNLNKAFEVENGISLNNNIFIFEGSDDPSIALSSPDIPKGSIYVQYGTNSSMYQKTDDTSYKNITEKSIDGGNANSVYLPTQKIDGGGA